MAVLQLYGFLAFKEKLYKIKIIFIVTIDITTKKRYIIDVIIYITTAQEL